MQAASPVLLVRADANARMGTGHVMRCLALAQVWQDRGGRTVFALAGPATPVEGRILAEDWAVERVEAEPGSSDDAAATGDLARRLGADWVVLDGYHFDGSFQRRVKDAGPAVLAMDDHGHAGHYAADLVLNQNLHAGETLYRDREPHTALLLGTRYALLRREFRRWRTWRRSVPALAQKVVVSLGGADPDNATLQVLHALDLLPADSFEAIVVAGAGNPHLPALRQGIRGREPAVRLLDQVNDMPELMAWADVAVAAGGSASWERALLGLPSLVLVLADNQAAVAASCARAGIARDLGWHHAVTADDLAAALTALLHDAAGRAAMARRGPELVDGLGAERVVERMRGPDVCLRAAGPDDCRAVWEWANDPVVRAISFSPEPIPWETHRAWYAAKLVDPQCVLWIATSGGVPVGQVRCDLDGTRAVLSICLDGQCRGRGYGPAVIRQVCQLVGGREGVDVVIALVREGNAASMRAFEKAGFVHDSDLQVRGWPARRYLWRARAAS